MYLLIVNTFLFLLLLVLLYYFFGSMSILYHNVFVIWDQILEVACLVYLRTSPGWVATHKTYIQINWTTRLLSTLRDKIFPVKILETTTLLSILSHCSTLVKCGFRAVARKSQESCCTPLANFVQLRYNVNKWRKEINFLWLKYQKT